MASIGLNVAWTGAHSSVWLQKQHATLARLVARQSIDLSGTFAAYRAAGIRPLLVCDRESIEAYGSVDSDQLAASAAAALSDYWRRYAEYDPILQPGNEPDHTSPSSWTMSQADMVTLGRTARRVAPTATIITAGLASGQPSWLYGIDLGWADAVAVHPYGKRATPEWPNPTWGTGYLGDLIDGYAALGLPLFVTEMGISTTEVSEEFQAEYTERCLDALNVDSRVVGVTWFCSDDETMVPEYGIWRDLETPKLAASAFARQAAGQMAVPLPTPGTPPIPPIPTPEPVPSMSALDHAVVDLWQAVVPGLAYNPDAALAKYWRAHPEIGSPVGHEWSDGDGTAYQAFATGVYVWRGGDAVERAA